MNKSDFKKKKVIMEAPKYVPQLKFRSLKELNESGLSMLFWSENIDKFNLYGKEQNEFLSYMKEGKIFHIFINGETLEGKGVTLENIAEYYKKNFKDYVIIDVSGKNYEGCFWAKKYKCYFVYPQLLKAKQKNDNENIIEKKLNKKNHWKKLIQMANKNKRVLVLMCRDPLEQSFLKAQAKLFDLLNKDETMAKYRKVLLLREISFIGYKHGTLKASTSRWALENKRLFVNLCRTGRHGQNQIIADAQRFQDVDSALGDNVALKIYKRTNTFTGNYPKYIQDTIKTLEKHQAVFEFRGKAFTGVIKYNEWHKTEKDKIEDLKVYPTIVNIENFNKLKENRYIDRVSEEWTNYDNRLIIGRRRHLQNAEDTKLCSFEIADLLGLDCELNINGAFKMEEPRLIYGEIKFRSPDSKHPKIETGDVKKTIQDLSVKKIVFDDEKNTYFWTLEPDLAKQLNWKMTAEYFKIPCIIEMVTTVGATTGAFALMKKHNIKLRVIKIGDDFFD